MFDREDRIGIGVLIAVMLLWGVVTIWDAASPDGSRTCIEWKRDIVSGGHGTQSVMMTCEKSVPTPAFRTCAEWKRDVAAGVPGTEGMIVTCSGDPRP